MQQPSPLWPWQGLRRALCVLLLLLGEVRKAVTVATPSASSKAAKARMEIRVQDFSFSDGARERPVIEVVTKDVKTSDLYSIMEGTPLVRALGGGGGGGEDCVVLLSNKQYAIAVCAFPAIRGGNDVSDDAAGDEISWWKTAVTDDFSRQDVVVLALIALCMVRLLLFTAKLAWTLVRLHLRWYGALGTGNRGDDGLAPLAKKQLAVIRFCHLQFLLVVEKLKREMRGTTSDATQQMVASLPARQSDGKDVTLTAILETLQEIQAKDCSFVASEVEEHLAGVSQDEGDEVDAEADLPEAWDRLREVYASFQSIQAVILRRQQHRKIRRRQLAHEQHQRRRRHRVSSYEEPADEVLQQLQELTKELPQGFTAEMFASLGSAINEETTAPEPEQPASPVHSPQPETKTPRPIDATRTSIACADAR
ncbi:hypothetical protein BBJ28_00023413 [Nothophytophthora sp. Chile5]|nr:hypothetical protein BBJ28_00023413 [Nothophytophthora sp. Chile5]